MGINRQLCFEDRMLEPGLQLLRASYLWQKGIVVLIFPVSTLIQRLVHANRLPSLDAKETLTTLFRWKIANGPVKSGCLWL